MLLGMLLLFAQLLQQCMLSQGLLSILPDASGAIQSSCPNFPSVSHRLTAVMASADGFSPPTICLWTIAC